MKKYLYYPGCSLKGTGRAYEESILAVFAGLGVELEELEGWNCCGATAYMSVDELKAFALAARNLALAEGQDGHDGPIDMVVPCAACYLVLSKTQKCLGEQQETRRTISEGLRSVGLSYHGRVRVRHPLDVLVNDVGLEKIGQAAGQPLKGLKVACYYGCQIVRPYAQFDDQYNPMAMDRLVKALGAEPVDWPLKTRCCGGSLTGTVQEAGLRLSQILLVEARKRGAQMVATACPLCQFNLECYQKPMSRRFGQPVDMPVAYFSQLVGLAMGIEPRKLGVQRLMMPLAPALATA